MSDTTDDFVGTVHGRLTVIEKTDRHKKGSGSLYKCICSCAEHNIVYATKSDLNNKTKPRISCGCIPKEKIALEGQKKSRYKIGDIVGIWKLLEKTDKRVDGRVVWKCQCQECGFIREIPTSQLRPSGVVVLCKCQKKLSHGSYGETKIIELLSNAGIDFEQEYSFSDLTSNGKKLRFDFYLPKQNYLIEFDGRQHFPNNQNKYWCGNDTYETIHNRDMMKNEYCLSHNIPLIRIPYTHLSKMTLSDLLLENNEFIVMEV